MPLLLLFAGLASRQDFGWGFFTSAQEGPRPDGPREGFTALAQGLRAQAQGRQRQLSDVEEEERIAGKPTATHANWTGGAHVVQGVMTERGLCQFAGRPAAAAKRAERRARHGQVEQATFREDDHVARAGLGAAWSSSTRPLHDPAQNWTKPTRTTVDRNKVRCPPTHAKV